MLSREDFYMIKKMRKQGAYIVDIATQVGCSERTVRRYLKYPEPLGPGTANTRSCRPTKRRVLSSTPARAKPNAVICGLISPRWGLVSTPILVPRTF